MSNAAPQIEIRDHRNRDWFWGNNGLIDWYGDIVGADSIAVYMVLARYANTEGESWPSYQTIATRLKISRPTVIKSMRKLEEAGLITKSKRTQETKEGGTMPDSNKYLLLSIKPLDEPSKAALLGVIKEIDHPKPSKGDLLVKEVDSPSKGDLPHLVKDVYLNKTHENKTQRTRESVEANAAVSSHTHPAVEMYQKAFPQVKLTKVQVKEIADTVGEGVENLALWQETVRDYELSPRWHPDNVGNMLSRFKNKLKAQQHTNGTGKRKPTAPVPQHTRAIVFDDTENEHV